MKTFFKSFFVSAAFLFVASVSNVQAQNNNDPAGIYVSNQNGNNLRVWVQRNGNNWHIQVFRNGKWEKKKLKSKNGNTIVIEDTTGDTTITLGQLEGQNTMEVETTQSKTSLFLDPNAVEPAEK